MDAQAAVIRAYAKGTITDDQMTKLSWALNNLRQGRHAQVAVERYEREVGNVPQFTGMKVIVASIDEHPMLATRKIDKAGGTNDGIEVLTQGPTSDPNPRYAAPSGRGRVVRGPEPLPRKPGENTASV